MVAQPVVGLQRSDQNALNDCPNGGRVAVAGTIRVPEESLWQAQVFFDIVMPTDRVPGPPQGQWTYDDHGRIRDDGQRYEVIDGVLFVAPTSRERHQNAIVNVAGILGMHVKLAGLGRVYVAPFDVTLPSGVRVQPDVVVVLNRNPGIITPGRISGTPDLVIEIASPSTATCDRRTKVQAYARAGVAEY